MAEPSKSQLRLDYANLLGIQDSTQDMGDEEFAYAAIDVLYCLIDYIATNFLGLDVSLGRRDLPKPPAEMNRADAVAMWIQAYFDIDASGRYMTKEQWVARLREVVRRATVAKRGEAK